MRTRPLALFALVVSAAACSAEDECEDAIAVQEECAAEAGVEVSLDAKDICDDTERSEDYWRCVEDAFDAADCSTAEGYNDALDALDACLVEDD